MKQTSTTKTPATSDVDAPALTQAHFDRAKFRAGGHIVDRSQWQAAVLARVATERISIVLDSPVVARYMALVSQRGYQTLINDTLRHAIESERFVQDMRIAIRKELPSFPAVQK